MKSRRPIGVFDSGLGGLTVVKELVRLLPKENLIYVGDTARVPYGTKSPETIQTYTRQITKFLLKKNVKAIVVACNSASSVALDGLKSSPVPVIGVIHPGARAAVQRSDLLRVGVIGTQATIRSRSYERALMRYSSKVRVWTRACPLFVPLVEEGRTDGLITRQVVREYLVPLKRHNIDTLVLGCTHYPLLKNAIRAVMGKGIQLIDSAQETAQEVKMMLGQKNWLNSSSRKGRILFYTTDNAQFFTKLGFRFLGKAIRPASRLPLEKLL